MPALWCPGDVVCAIAGWSCAGFVVDENNRRGGIVSITRTINGVAVDTVDIDQVEDEIVESMAANCRKCEAWRERGYRNCDGCESGPSDEGMIDKAYPWLPGFAGS